jgi:hypothetical protein
LSVTEERRITTRRREAGRTASRRGARVRPDPATAVDELDPAELRRPTDQVLPPGRRDDSGFWIPEGYDEPEALFSPHQRRLQEKQRQAHRARRQRDEDDGDARVDSPDPSE